MADRIESIQRIEYNSTIVTPVRRYTKSEKKTKMEMLEKQISNHEEMTAIHREIKEKYPNPQKLSFKELLQQEMKDGPDSDSITNQEDDDGFILDLK